MKHTKLLTILALPFLVLLASCRGGDGSVDYEMTCEMSSVGLESGTVTDPVAISPVTKDLQVSPTESTEYKVACKIPADYLNGAGLEASKSLLSGTGIESASEEIDEGRSTYLSWNFMPEANDKDEEFLSSMTTNDEEIIADFVEIVELITIYVNPIVIVADTDHDGVADNDDNCPEIPNTNQFDDDNDGVGNVCEVILGDDDDDSIDDYDADGIEDALDNCPLRRNYLQTDSDEDGIGNACDTSPYPNRDDPSLPSRPIEIPTPAYVIDDETAIADLEIRIVTQSELDPDEYHVAGPMSLAASIQAMYDEIAIGSSFANFQFLACDQEDYECRIYNLAKDGLYSLKQGSNTFNYSQDTSDEDTLLPRFGAELKYKHLKMMKLIMSPQELVQDRYMGYNNSVSVVSIVVYFRYYEEGELKVGGIDVDLETNPMSDDANDTDLTPENRMIIFSGELL